MRNLFFEHSLAFFKSFLKLAFDHSRNESIEINQQAKSGGKEQMQGIMTGHVWTYPLMADICLPQYLLETDELHPSHFNTISIIYKIVLFLYFSVTLLRGACWISHVENETNIYNILKY